VAATLGLLAAPPGVARSLLHAFSEANLSDVAAAGASVGGMSYASSYVTVTSTAAAVGSAHRHASATQLPGCYSGWEAAMVAAGRPDSAAATRARVAAPPPAPSTAWGEPGPATAAQQQLRARSPMAAMGRVSAPILGGGAGGGRSSSFSSAALGPPSPAQPGCTTAATAWAVASGGAQPCASRGSSGGGASPLRGLSPQRPPSHACARGLPLSPSRAACGAGGVSPGRARAPSPRRGGPHGPSDGARCVGSLAPPPPPPEPALHLLHHSQSVTALQQCPGTPVAEVNAVNAAHALCELEASFGAVVRVGVTPRGSYGALPPATPGFAAAAAKGGAPPETPRPVGLLERVKAHLRGGLLHD
jgi:hypothetical protein